MDNIQPHPVKMYIQDIYRAKTTPNKYIHELFGMTFKNIMIHGVITAMYNTSNTTTNAELSDATGSVQIYYDSAKSNSRASPSLLKDLFYRFGEATRSKNDNVNVMSNLLDHIAKNPINFKEGDYVSVVGDIFVDDRNMRMISAYECTKTNADRDIVWMEELKYLYENFYMWAN